MITGYEVGTEVKWNEENTLETGIIQEVYRQSADAEVNGKTVHIDVSSDSPTYLIRQSDGKHIVLPHQQVMLKSTNLHT